VTRCALSPPDNIILRDLGNALRVTLRGLGERCREGLVDDLTESWAQSAASLLDFGLERAPSVEMSQPTFPFCAPHRVTTELYRVANGGLGGGPSIDVLLQIWFNTEAIRTAFGTPLLLRRVQSFGPVAPGIWAELREISLLLNTITCAGRVLMIGHPDPFETRPSTVIDSKPMYALPRTTPMYALPTTLLAGMINPPHGLSGQILEHFPDDLVSGWIGDPALGGESGSLKLDAFLGTFDVNRILRIRIDQS